MVVFSLINVWQPIPKDEANKFFNIALGILFASIIIVAVIRRLLKTKTLRLDPESLSIKNKRLEVQDISVIYISHNKTIGIKPKKHRIVPISLCFELIKNQNDIEQLISWAKSKDINIEYGNFMKWI